MTDVVEHCRGHLVGSSDRVFAAPGTPEQLPRDRSFQIQHLRLEITVDDAARSVSGAATYRLAPINDGLREVVFDADSLRIRRITDGDGKVLEWDYRGDALTIHLPRARRAGEAFGIRIRYEATPKKGLFFMAPDKAYPNRARIVWSQGEEMDNHSWFPSYDYPNQKFTSEMLVTVADKYVAVSNGRLVSEKRDARRRTRTFHWLQDKPHPTYLIALVVGEFDTKEWTADGVPIQVHVPKGMGRSIDFSFGRVPEMVRFFNRVTGLKYPWDRYAQACVPEFTAGGMENTGLTILYEYCLIDEKAFPDYNPDYLLSHELAHQWFGDYVTTKSWGHLWLNESFATYMEILWYEEKFGLEDAIAHLEYYRGRYFGEAERHYRRPIVTHAFEDPEDMLDMHTYEKGASVLHLMRNVLGDALWWKSIRHYLKKHPFANVETNDLKVAIEEATGRNLDWFFDEWLLKPGHPEFEVSWSYDDAAKQVEVRVKQVQDAKDGTPIFRISAEVEIAADDRSWRQPIQIEKAEHVFRFPAAKRPRTVLFDPDDAILKKLTFKKTKQEFLWQLAHAKGFWPRIEACEGLGKILSDEEVVGALGKTLAKDRAWSVRRAAADALGAIASPASRDALLAGARDKDSRVRRRVYAALGKFRKDDVAFKALAKAYMDDGSYYPMSDAAKALAETRHPKAFETIVKGMDRPSQREFVAYGAAEGLADLRDERGIDVLMERTAYGQPELRRLWAATALGRLGSHHEKRRDEVLEHLASLLRDPNFRAKCGAAIGLGELGYRKAEGELQKAADTEVLGAVRHYARFAIRQIREKGAEGAKRLEQQEELDRLKDEHRELKARVATLEARLEAAAKRRA